MLRVSTPAVLVAAALAVGAVTAPGPAAAASDAARATTAPRLATFSSCGQLLSYTRTRALGLLRPYGLAGFASARPMPLDSVAAPGPTAGAPERSAAAPTQGVDYSGTNVQEAGVDEPDIMKTNGRTMFVATEGLGEPSIQAIDVTGGSARQIDRQSLPRDMGGLQLLLSGDRLLVIASGNLSFTPPPPPEPIPVEPPVGGGTGVAPDAPVRSSPVMPQFVETGTVMILIDVSNPSAMRTIETLRLRGSFLAARLSGTSARVVASSEPRVLPLVTGGEGLTQTAAAALRTNRRIIVRSKLRTWGPSYRVKRRGKLAAERPLVPCTEVSRPQVFSGLRTVSVSTIDLTKGLVPTDTDAVQTDGELVYASPTALYVGTSRWIDPEAAQSPDTVRGMATQIHRFDISSPTQTAYVGTGVVPGFLLNQFSMSEHEGTLRVASTDMPPWWGTDRESESRVTTLQLRDGVLARVGQVGGMGRGERIYAVRFLGDRGYVVTFRQTDPLYTLDLSDPAKPVVRGELKIPGYSAYLHPINDTLLLGVGQNATDQGRVLGTQVSLFDVSDLANPTRLQQTTFPDSWSEAESDHHAFLYWAPTGLAVIPVSAATPDGRVSLEAAGFFVSRESGITCVRRVAHPDDPNGLSAIRRSAVVGDALYTVSSRGVMVSDLSSLVERSFLAFPVAP
jgi:uncharacterized secreted protein with C-terminal beta-propeller domain